MRDKLINLSTIGIARYHVKRASGDNPDMAAIIADVLIENGYRKSTDVAEEILDDLRGIYDYWRNDDCIRESSAIILAIAELKKKYV